MTPEERDIAEGILFTDMYQFTMAQLYFRHGLAERPAQFDYFFRSYPDYGEHKAGYCVNAGLAWLLDWLATARFGERELAFLREQRGSQGRRLFGEDFLVWLGRQGGFSGISLRAVPEGRVVHPHVPLVVVQGPLAVAQILETPLLNHLTYQTLVATKAARIREVAGGSLLLEFGMRRAHERGASAGARAALIGGCDFTSNTGASAILGTPPKGTHAHSMVQAFMALGGSEVDAFRAYAETYPDDCLLLVDTVDTLASGLPNAIRVFSELRRDGHEPVGIRLDSGDLAYLAIQSARLLDDAGFENVSIVLSNQLDELVIWQIVTQIRREAPRYGVDADRLVARLVYGVGTRLITSRGDSALDGVYKLVAVHDGRSWVPAIKLSETPAKTINPGDKGVWRLYDRRGRATADVLSHEGEDPRQERSLLLHSAGAGSRRRTLVREEISAIEPLLGDVLRSGTLVSGLPGLAEARALRDADIERLDPGVRRLMNPHIYHVSITDRLFRARAELAERLRAG